MSIRGGLALFVICLIPSGCYNRTDVIPAELIKMNSLESPENCPWSPERDRVLLVRANGGVVEADCQSEVEIVAKGRVAHFELPLQVEFSDDKTKLTIQGPTGSETFTVASLERATVVKPDRKSGKNLSVGVLTINFVALLLAYLL